MADWMANYPFHPAHLASACTVFPDHPVASAALAAQDAVLRRIAAHFPVSFPALVRGCRSASALTASLAVFRPHQVLQPQVAHPKVVTQPYPRGADRQAQQAVDHPAQPSAGPLLTADE
jgi:hypothetical protein